MNQSAFRLVLPPSIHHIFLCRELHRDNRAAFNKSIAAAAIYDYEYRIRRKEWSAQRLDDAARETEEP